MWENQECSGMSDSEAEEGSTESGNHWATVQGEESVQGATSKSLMRMYLFYRDLYCEQRIQR